MRINILEAIYPIGSYYISSLAQSPAENVGGSWVSLDEGTFLCAAGDTIATDSRGGANKVTLALDEIPGAFYRAWHNADKYPDIELDLLLKFNNGSIYGISAQSTTSKNPDLAFAPHENMPQYVAAYIWKRVA